MNSANVLLSGLEKIMIYFKLKKSDLFLFFLNSYFRAKFYQVFETGLSAQSHKQHDRHASAISGYTLAEQQVSKLQLKFHYLGYISVMLYSII